MQTLSEFDFCACGENGLHYAHIELTSFKGRRVVAFRKNLIEMAELEIKHAKVSSTAQEHPYFIYAEKCNWL